MRSDFKVKIFSAFMVVVFLPIIFLYGCGGSSNTGESQSAAATTASATTAAGASSAAETEKPLEKVKFTLYTDDGSWMKDSWEWTRSARSLRKRPASSWK